MKCPMIYNDFIDVPDADMKPWEAEYYLKEQTEALYRINAQDYDQQMADQDFFVAPGRFISDDCLKALPPTAVLTSEFDSVGRGARAFAERL